MHKYFCDICGKEVFTPMMLNDITIPTSENVANPFFEKVQACMECRQAIKGVMIKSGLYMEVEPQSKTIVSPLGRRDYKG